MRHWYASLVLLALFCTAAQGVAIADAADDTTTESAASSWGWGWGGGDDDDDYDYSYYEDEDDEVLEEPTEKVTEAVPTEAPEEEEEEVGELVSAYIQLMMCVVFMHENEQCAISIIEVTVSISSSRNTFA